MKCQASHLQIIQLFNGVWGLTPPPGLVVILVPTSWLGSFLQDEVILISYYSWDKRPISLQFAPCWRDMSGASLQLTILWTNL